ncbi:thiamine pyrophosphate-dependent acetolactate synthase large subunit-like protein [Streptomyces canus]|uniref:thiamine pyrophosphate-binding protein n=1 Tax=Streptomyces canus TaxID=58343 RepID=UPI00277E625C|nr:thiamine pyrophosphate-binding protein [Streptomyces canus]MDQ0597960.1 thiamine pyrophosphate-dependent acetolactate synthase large subunit-like protein [Streptomyces canus]
MARTVARVIVDALGELGVRQVFGVVGDALNPVTDAIRTTESLEWVGCRHEEAAAFACSTIPTSDPAELEDSVRRAFRTEGPVLLDVLTNPDEIAVPAKPTVEQGWGYAVAKMKEVVRSHGEGSGH